jgi:hypothetical protein
MESEPCEVALKEWGATVEALRLGRQVLLLRKGGIHDAGGVFELEHTRFWMVPNAFHQDKPLLKPQHLDLLEAPVSNRAQLSVQVLACAVASWSVGEEAFVALSQARHIWNEDYLSLRFEYKPQHPLGVVAVRAYEIPAPHTLAGRPEYFGCRSWIELAEPLETVGARPVLEDEVFNTYLGELREVLGAEREAASG